ncbi:MAG TPA: hypothetical protein VHH15_18535 [Actinophytocola sp.]|nr:hypothetical protein [Actinophytocola sp.]
MSAPLEVPRLADLDDLAVEASLSDASGVVSVTAWANDGSVVVLTWDEIAGSVSVRCTQGGEERLVIERETASKVSVREEYGRVEFWIWSGAEGLGGQLVVRVGAYVGVSDVLLRK